MTTFALGYGRRPKLQKRKLDGSLYKGSAHLVVKKTKLLKKVGI